MLRTINKSAKIKILLKEGYFECLINRKLNLSKKGYIIALDDLVKQFRISTENIW